MIGIIMFHRLNKMAKLISKDEKIKRGFTIIELIIVMAVFLFVIGAAIGIFISIVKNQKR